MLSALGRYRAGEGARGALIAVAGCVAQQEKEQLLKRVPYLDFVFGPDAHRPAAGDARPRARPGARRRDRRGWTPRSTCSPAPTRSGSRGKVTEFVTVMKGCDNVCAFCVVPHTRGREVSRAVRRGRSPRCVALARWASAR